MKRFLSGLLVLVMLVTMLPQVTVFAQEEETESPVSPGSLPELSLGETVLTQDDDHFDMEYHYAFVPETSGFYVFETQNDSFDTEASITDPEGTVLGEDTDSGNYSNFRLHLYLKAGKTYTLDMKAQGLGELILQAQLETAVADAALGVSQEIYVETEVRYTYVAFTAEEEGVYTFESDGEWDVYGSLYSTDMQLLEENDDDGGNYNYLINYSLKAGETVLLGTRFLDAGKEGYVNVLVDTFFIKSVTCHPLTLTELSSGHFYGNDLQYFNYDWVSQLTYDVTLRDGTVETFTGGGFHMNGSWFEVTASDDQSGLNAWTAGNTYSATASIAGFEVPVEITVTESPVESVTVGAVSMYQHTGGNYNYEYNEALGQSVRAGYYYQWWDQLSCTAQLADGTALECTGGYYEYDGKTYQVIAKNDQDGDNEWNIGKHTVAFYILGHKVTTEVEILPSPVASVTMDKVFIPKETNGWYDSYWDDAAGSNVEYFYYSWYSLMHYTVTLQDGKSYEGNGSEIVVEDKFYSAYYDEPQQNGNFWDVGTYTVTVELLGYEVPVTVEIVDSPIKEAELQGIALMENAGGSTATDENGNSYYQYRWWDVIPYIVTMLDGTVLEGTGSGISYNGQYIPFEHSDDQSASNPWTAGNTYYPTVTIGDQTITVSVEIRETEVESIVFNPVSIMEGTCGDLCSGETGVFFAYYWWERLSGTVYFKNGESDQFSGTSFDHNGTVYEVRVFDNQSSEAPWTAGNTYTCMVEVTGVPATVPVQITERPIKSVVYDPISILELTGGYYYDDDPNFYYYKWYEKLSYTVTFADGTTGHFTGTSFTHNGETYEFGFSDDQDRNSVWQAGETYSVNVSVCGMYDKVSVTITPSEVMGITPNPLTLPAATCGELVREDGNELFFRYHWWKYITYTVHFRDGTQMEVTGESFTYNDITYTLGYTDEQRWDNAWTEGSEHFVNMNVGAAAGTATVSISAPVEDFQEYPAMYVGSNTVNIANGGDLAIFRFTPEKTGVYTIISNADADTYGYLLDSGLRVLHQNDDGGINNQFRMEYELTAGKTYVVVARYYSVDRTGSFEVTVTKTIGIDRVDFAPVVMTAGVGGSYTTDGSDQGSYYRYYWWEKLSYDVYLENGDSGSFTDTGFNLSGMYYALNWEDSQSAANPWQPGGVYEVPVTVGGKQYTVTVSIAESDVVSAAFLPITVFQEATGFYNNRWNPNTQQDESFFQYYWWDNMGYEITFVNGETASGRGSDFFYNGQYYSFDRAYDGQLDEPWQPGTTHYVTIQFAGETYEIPVTVQPVRVRSIYVEPVVLLQNTGGYLSDSYSGAYYHYHWYNQMKWTVTFESGATFTGNGPGFYMDEVWNYVQYKDNQSYENQYTVGATYENTVKIFGVETTVQVTVTDSAGGQAGDNAVWSLDSEGNFVISGQGELYQYSGSSNMAWDKYKNSIKTVTIGEGITHLGNFAFYDCPNLKTVNFSSTVVDTGFYTFHNCIGLETVVLGSGVQVVGDHTFSYCTNLREVTIPKSVTEIREWAFYPCSDLKTVYYLGTEMGWTDIIQSGFNPSLDEANKIFLGVAVTVAEGTEGTVNWVLNSDGVLKFTGEGQIPDYSPENPAPWAPYMTQIRSVILEGPILEIGDYAFYGATALKAFQREFDLLEIGSYAFYDCDSLVSFNLWGIDVIGSHAFEECSSLFYIALSSGWSSIGDCAFLNSNLSELEYDGPGYRFYQENIGIGNDALLDARVCSYEEEGVVCSGRCGDGVYWILYQTGELKVFGEGAIFDYGDRQKPWDRGYPIQAIRIEEGITSIGEGAFAHSGNAQTLTIPGTVTYIGSTAFMDLANVREVILPEGVEELGAEAFIMSGMETLQLPESLRIIGAGAFRHCSNLPEVTIPKGVETIGIHAFQNCNAMTAIRVEEENPYFSSDDSGVLYDKNKQTLICAPCFLSGSFTVPETVTVIAESAFESCKNLQEVILPDSVTEVGSFAFRGCYGLSSVKFGSGLTALSEGMFAETGFTEFVIPAGITTIGVGAFQGCEVLETVTIPETVTVIEANAFASCFALTNAPIPASVTRIGENAFNGCYKLTEVRLPASVKEVGAFAYADCTELTTVEIPDTVETIGAYAFTGCTNLTELNLGKNVKSIGDSAFEGCVGLKEVTVPQGVTQYVYRMFAGCTSLEKVTIPGTVKSIGEQTFADCNALTEITIPDSVESLGDYAFKQCENLSVIHLGKGVSQMGSNVFVSCNSLSAFRVHAENQTYASDEAGVLFDKRMEKLLRAPIRLSGSYAVPDGTVEITNSAFEGCTELENVTVPGSVKVILESAFADCWNLKSAALAEGVTYIGDFAFACCSELEEIVIPGTVTGIGTNCFVDCVALKRATLPENMTVIPEHTFGWCGALESVRIPKAVTTIDYAAFIGCYGLQEVIYGGTAKDWMAIEIFGDNESLAGAFYIYEGDNELLDSGYCGENVQWMLTVGGKLTILGEGAMANYGGPNGAAPWARYSNEINFVEILEGVTFVGDDAFSGCTEIVEVVMADTVTELGIRSFSGCTKLQHISLSANLVTLNASAFAECSSLRRIELPETLQTLGELAFGACYSLTELRIPASVTTISGDLFYNSNSLTGIYVDAGNPNYTSVDGVLFNQDMTQLLRAPCALSGSYTVPETVKTIAPYAFFPCSGLSEVHLPESLERIGNSAFEGCNCITDVYYAGSETTWSRVTVGENNLTLKVATFHYGREADLGTGTCGDNITWVLDPEGVMTLSGSGDMYDYCSDPWSNPWVELKDRITSLVVEESITGIGSGAFDSCQRLSSVQLPASLTGISDRAFYNCDGLYEINLPAGVETLGESAFESCEQLSYVTGASNVSVIRTRAFANCTNLWNYSFESGLTYIGDEAFMNTGLSAVILPETLQAAGDRVFAGSNLTEATVMDGQLTRLGNGFFQNCPDLMAVNLGSSVTELGDDVFNGCCSLRSVMMSDSLTVIGVRAFRDCTALTGIYLPAGVKEIREETFFGCNSLTAVNLDNGVESIGSYAFYGAAIEDLSAGNILKTIGNGAFGNCQNLKGVSGMDSVTEIGSNAFENCASLQSFTVPAGVTQIRSNTFAGCGKLSYVELGKNVTSIENGAFGNCYSIANVCFNGTKKEFESIAVGDDNACLLNAELYCTEKPENVYYCEHCQEEVEWLDWTGNGQSGHYRLVEDYTGTETRVGTATLSDVELVLDLNGHTIASDKRVFTVYANNRLTVLDTVGGGVISGGYSNTIGGAVLVTGNGASFYLRNGTVTSQGINSGGCVYVTNGGYFHMFDGQLIGSALSNGRRGGALYVAANSSVYIGDALVTDGVARGAGIYLADGSNLYLNSTTVGEILAANTAYLKLQGTPVVETLDLTSGARLDLEGLYRGARITVYADDVFTRPIAEAEEFVSYFNPGFEHSVITVESNALKVAYPDEQQVIDITVLEIPAKWEYEEGEALDLTGLMLLVYYSDGYEEVVESGYTYYGFDSETPGTKTVYVSYGDYETSFNVIVREKQVTDVRLHNYPFKTEYLAGEELDISGLGLSVDYSNGSGEIVFEGFIAEVKEDFTIPGTHTVYISYEGFTVTFDVTVKSREVEILKQPESITILEGETARFTVEANNAVSYRWQVDQHKGKGFYNTSMTGYKTDTLTVEATLVRSGYSFRCALTDADGNVTYTQEVTLEVIPLVITVTGIRLEKLPQKLVYEQGEALDLTGMELIASYSYGPEQIISEGYTVSGFDSSIPGEQTVTVTYEGATAEFTVTVNAAAAEITGQPESVTADSGTSVSFSVKTEGDVAAYQWQYNNGGDEWFNATMSSANAATLTLTAIGERNGCLYRCVVTFANGKELISESAKLTVNTVITVTDHPNDQVIALGYKGQFTVAASGEGLKYQWQYKRPNSEKWSDTTMEGADKPTVFIETTAARNGYQYRCEIKDVTGNVAYSEPATMTVLNFTSQPEDARSPVNGTVTFTVEASAESGFTYQWQYRRSATGSWTNTTMTGYNTATLTVGATKTRNGYQYRCVLTGAKNSKLESKAATLYVSEPVKITAQPGNVTCAAGAVATFTVEATNVLSYQWQYQRPTGTVWSNTSADGNKTAALNVTTKASNNGYKYRCVIIGMDGQEYVTEMATLTIG